MAGVALAAAAVGWLGAGALGAQGAARGATPPAAPTPRPGATNGTAAPAGSAAQAPSANGLVAWEWWNDAEVQKELGLTGEKVKRIDDYYQQRVRQLTDLGNALRKEQQELDRMTTERVVDESVYNVQLVREETLRYELSKSRFMMLYRMYRELTPDQYKKFLDILNKRRDANSSRGRSFGPGR